MWGAVSHFSYPGRIDYAETNKDVTRGAVCVHMLMTQEMVLYAIFVPLITAIAVWIRQRSQSQFNTNKTADDMGAAVIDMAKQGQTVVLSLRDVVVANTLSNERNAAELKGIMLAFESRNKDVDEVVTGYRTHYPLLQEGIKTIQSSQTELGDSITELSQFGPVVDALKDVGGQVRKLAEEIEKSDRTTNLRLSELTAAFQLAETRFVDRLDKFVAQRSTATIETTSVEQIETLTGTNGEIHA